MDTVALRFSDNFAPEIGTIGAHEELIKKYGFVWYGKLGLPLSDKMVDVLMKNEIKKILLIKSGKAERYWLYFDAIEKKVPESKHIPAYYRKKAADFKTWFRTVKIEVAPNDIMSKCYVKSSGAVLSNASRHSMSPYFIITTEE